MSFVNDKMGAALNCQFRTLAPGETPKHPGQTTVYEAANGLNPQFEADLKAGLLQASWKIDGTCCMVSGDQLYRRLDIRKGAAIPDGAIMGEMEDGVAKICWLLVNGSTDPGDQWHLSALSDGKFWTLDDGIPTLETFDPTEKATYELIGPKIGPNPYGLEEVMVNVNVNVKGVVRTKSIQRHYLVRHGDDTFDFPTESLLQADDKVAWFKDFVLEHNVEGIVFRHVNDSVYYKVNRGHIGVKPSHSEKYVLSPNF